MKLVVKSLLAAAAVVGMLVTSGCTLETMPNSRESVVVTPGTTSITVSPVDFGGKGLVSTSFGTVAEGAAVVLQRQGPSGWEDVANGRQDKNGRADFQLELEANDVFRAVTSAPNGGGAQAETTTAEASAKQQWQKALSTGFSGSALDDEYWDYRGTGSYEAGGRQCSAPFESNVELSDGKVKLAVTAETEAKNVAAAKSAGCEEALNFRNAMISTENKFSIKTGVVAARVKFPEGQGMHGSVWLQSAAASEIDFVESYGYGKGLTSVVHVDGKRNPSKGKDTYVLSDLVKDRAWWSQYHVFSVEWDREEIIFRIDGIETKRLQQATPDADYFIVLSMLSSDWEQKRFTDPVKNAEGVTATTLPQTMSVDWVKAWARA